jgi:hypothetical protein
VQFCWADADNWACAVSTYSLATQRPRKQRRE